MLFNQKTLKKLWKLHSLLINLLIKHSWACYVFAIAMIFHHKGSLNLGELSLKVTQGFPFANSKRRTSSDRKGLLKLLR